MYNCHKGVHCLRFQSVVAPNGIIASLFGPVGKQLMYTLYKFFGFITSSCYQKCKENVLTTTNVHQVKMGIGAYFLKGMVEVLSFSFSVNVQFSLGGEGILGVLSTELYGPLRKQLFGEFLISQIQVQHLSMTIYPLQLTQCPLRG